jgi:hypothetical protein
MHPTTIRAMAQPSPSFRFISEAELSRIIDIKPKTLQRWRLAGIGPKFRKLGNAQAKRSPIRYDLAAVEQWLQAQAEGGGMAA